MDTMKLKQVIIILFTAITFEIGTHFANSSLLQANDSSITLLRYEDGTTTSLKPAICSYAKELYGWLNTTYNQTLFNTQLLKNPQATAKHLEQSKDLKGHSARNKTIRTSDGALIQTTFIDHTSEILLIVGSGFSFDRRSLASFACYKPDIVLFQPRGHGIDHTPTTRKGKLSHTRMGVDSAVCRLGAIEEQDVIAVTDYYKKQKRYKTVCYLGICYSAVIGAKASILRPDLFDKLILDGAWPSGKELIKRYINNPMFFFNPQTRSTGIPRFMQNKLTHSSLKICIEKLFGFKLDEAIEGTTIFPYLNKPVLLFQGLNDTLVPTSDFESVFTMIPSPQKVAVLTESRHIQGHIKHKELYYLLCHAFIYNEFDTFNAALQDKELLAKLTKE